MLTFEIFGPYEIPKADKGNPISKSIKSTIWGEWEKVGCPNNLSKKAGCYVFGIRSSQGALFPCYVGKATKNFEQEIFTDDKLLKYNDSILGKNFGTPVMFFVAHPIQAGRKNSIRIKELESYLIAMAYKKNPDGLQNIHGVHDEKWCLGGFTKKGKPTKKTQDFARLMNLKKPV